MRFRVLRFPVRRSLPKQRPRPLLVNSKICARKVGESPRLGDPELKPLFKGQL